MDTAPSTHEAELRVHWTLEPETTFLNHGSFGATPRVVQEAQQAWRSRLEAQPVTFFVRTLPGALDTAREQLATFLGAHAERLTFVPNATAGVNTVLRSLAPSWTPGGNVVTTNHEYNACRNALEFVAAGAGLEVRVADVPFPLTSADAALEAILAQVDGATRLVLVDHVTSPTGLVLPIERLVPALRARGVPVLVDGAHAPGMLGLCTQGGGLPPRPRGPRRRPASTLDQPRRQRDTAPRAESISCRVRLDRHGRPHGLPVCARRAGLCRRARTRRVERGACPQPRALPRRTRPPL
jgi:kynureninase